MDARKIIFSFLLIFSVGYLAAQKKDNNVKEVEQSAQQHFDRYNQMYEFALSLNDFNVATVAVYEMMSLKPQRKDLKDTLAMLYFAQNQYQQAILLGEDILKEN